MAKRQRDYKAEYQARKARAQRMGYSGYGEQRRARRAADKGATAKAPPLRGGDRPGGTRRPRKQVEQRRDGATLVSTTAGGKGWHVIEGRAAKLDPDTPVRVLVDVRTRSGPRTVEGMTTAGRLAQNPKGAGVDVAAAAYSLGGGSWSEADVLGMTVELPPM